MKEISRAVYIGEKTTEHIMLGCLQRVADAQEAMAKPYVKLIADLEWYRSQWKEAVAQRDSLARTNNTLKGHITRLKNKLQP
ncbi:hypothetical protein [Rufibacter quisquiliarum]|uniref:Uncharacterized protein n=1 Tax=Rufibacter quisquiliarum TaxID=1549639 RepID=A0A839GHE9_9BACT|nr:hypothetical protein [Rufibacter quisquiliarum]MBA9078302.1 hypothetical protein [Rufibacter quisquiliarum]